MTREEGTNAGLSPDLAALLEMERRFEERRREMMFRLSDMQKAKAKDNQSTEFRVLFTAIQGNEELSDGLRSAIVNMECRTTADALAKLEAARPWLCQRLSPEEIVDAYSKDMFQILRSMLPLLDRLNDEPAGEIKVS